MLAFYTCPSLLKNLSQFGLRLGYKRNYLKGRKAKMLNPKILKENKLIIEGYKAKENARQFSVLICTDAENKTFEFVKVRDLPYQIEDDGSFMTVGQYLDTLESIVGANYQELLDLITLNKRIVDAAILEMADKIDKEKFL
jgi:ribosomal protein S6